MWAAIFVVSLAEKARMTLESKVEVSGMLAALDTAKPECITIAMRQRGVPAKRKWFALEWYDSSVVLFGLRESLM